MKKLLAILFCLVMVLSVALFTGCGKEKEADKEQPTSSASENKEENKEENKDDPINLGTCESCGEADAIATVTLDGETANVCAGCKEIVDGLGELEDALSDLEGLEDELSGLEDMDVADGTCELCMEATATTTVELEGEIGSFCDECAELIQSIMVE